MTAPQPMSSEAAIAVLFERLGHVVASLDALSDKIDRQDVKRTAALDELEMRVERIEKQVHGVRWFLAGIAAAGGTVGGTVAAGLVRMLGG